MFPKLFLLNEETFVLDCLPKTLLFQRLTLFFKFVLQCKELLLLIWFFFFAVNLKRSVLEFFQVAFTGSKTAKKGKTIFWSFRVFRTFFRRFLSSVCNCSICCLNDSLVNLDHFAAMHRLLCLFRFLFGLINVDHLKRWRTFHEVHPLWGTTWIFSCEIFFRRGSGIQCQVRIRHGWSLLQIKFYWTLKIDNFLVKFLLKLWRVFTFLRVCFFENYGQNLSFLGMWSNDDPRSIRSWIWCRILASFVTLILNLHFKISILNYKP